MQYCELRIWLPDALLHPMQAFIRHEDAVAYEEMVAWRSGEAEDFEYTLFYVEGDLERYRAAAADLDSVVSMEISPIDERSAHVWVCEAVGDVYRSMRQSLAGRDVIAVPPIRFDDEAAMELTLVGDMDAVESVLEDVPPGIDVDVLALGRYDRRGGTLVGTLTDRQLEALGTALELGYYAVPREATLADVASALGCTESTASVLLRRGEHELVSGVLDRFGGATGRLTESSRG